MEAKKRLEHPDRRKGLSDLQPPPHPLPLFSLPTPWGWGGGMAGIGPGK